MADGQVIIEFIAKADSLLLETDKADQSLDSFSRQTDTAETSMDELSDRIQDTAKREKELSANTDKAAKSTKTKTDRTKQAAKAEKEITAELKKESSATKENTAETNQNASAYQKLAGKISAAKKEYDKLEQPIKNISKIVGPMTSMLGALGVTAGISGLVQAFQEMAENAKKARDEYNKTQASFISYTGQLTETQQGIFSRVYEFSADNSGFVDKDQVVKAVSAVGQLWTDATEQQQEELARKLSTFQALGRIDDTAQFANDAKNAFKEWGISADEAAETLEFLYQVSAQTGAGMDTLIGTVSEYGADFKRAGIDFTGAIKTIGDTSATWGGNTKKLTEALTSGYDTAYSTKYEEIIGAMSGLGDMTPEQQKKLEADAEKQAQAYAETYVRTFQSTLETAYSTVDLLPDADTAYKQFLKEQPEIIRQIEAATEQERKLREGGGSVFDMQAVINDEKTLIQNELKKYMSGEEAYWKTAEYTQQLESYLGDYGTGKSVDEVLEQIRNTYGTGGSISDVVDTEGLEIIGEYSETLDQTAQNLTNVSTNADTAGVSLYSGFGTQVMQTKGQVDALNESLRTTIELEAQI